jgi:hypothetical protein
MQQQVIGVRDRMKLYEEDCQRKKEIERREKFEVQKLDASTANVTRFDSPTRKPGYVNTPANIGKVHSPGVFQFSLEDDPLGISKTIQEKKAHMKSLNPGLMCDMPFDSDSDDDDDVSVSKPKQTIRPGTMRGCSFDEDDPPSQSSPLHVTEIRSRTMRGSSYDGGINAPDKPPKVKNAEETKAKVALVELLYQDSKQGKGATVHLKSFSSLRNKYIISVNKMRPQSRSFSVQTKDDYKKDAEKAKKYDNLKKAWTTYKVTAQDKPDPGDDAVSKTLNSMRPGMLRGTSFDSDGDDVASKPMKNIRPGVRRGTSFDSDSDGDDDHGVVASKPVSRMRPGMTRGKSFDFDVDDDDSNAVSKPVSSMRPGMMRGKSFDFDADDYDGDGDGDAVSKPINRMRPGMTRGKSFDSDSDDGTPGKPQEVKDAEEKKAKIDLVELLNQDSEQEKGATAQLKSFSSLRNGYVSSVDVLRPGARPFSVQTKDDRKKEAEKVKTYDSLKNAWETYQETAQDKPDPGNRTPEEKAADEKVIEVETAVNGEWQEYAEEATKAIQDNDDSDNDSDDDSERDSEWAFWILEAKKLKAEAERKKIKEEKKRKKKEKKRMRKEKKAQRKMLEAEDGEISKRRMNEEASKTKENKGRFEKDSDSDDATASKAKSDDDVPTDGKVKNVGKPGKCKKGREREERRQKREAAKSKNTSSEDVKEMVVGTSELARRRQVAFSLYSQMSTPTRSEFRERVAALHAFSYNPNDVSPDDIDLLPWNAAASLVDIAKMNALFRASIMRPKE